MIIMRVLRKIVSGLVLLCAVLFLVGYARDVWWLRAVRPDSGIRVLTEANIVACYDYVDSERTGRRGLHLDPFFPPAFDLPLGSVQVFRVPSWVMAVLSGGVLAYAAGSVFRRRKSQLAEPTD